jgi:catechol 2,3-dioxygenase-like lactoylglutathione lyase family enzyme
MNLDHITLLVSSLERSLPYYEKLLPLVGFNKIKDYVWSNGSGFFFQFREAKTGTHSYERYGAGMNHLGFGAGSPEQVHAIRQSMADSGFEVPDIQLLNGSVALFMKDPDGIRFEVTYYPPGASVVD